jgi:hypothetical protein
MTMTTNVALLPAKWREEAERDDKAADAHTANGLKNLSITRATFALASRLRADELEAALAHRQDGELLASLLNRPNRVWRSESETGTEELARGIVIDPIELRTLASRRVTDEAMQRVGEYLEREHGVYLGTRALSAIVTAALQPDSGDA